MTQYIDKAAVVAEIERIEHETNYEPFTDEVLGKRCTCRSLLSFIDTFEVKDIEDMLEEAKDEAMRDIAWKVHVMISDGKSLSEIDHYVCGICDF